MMIKKIAGLLSHNAVAKNPDIYTKAIEINDNIELNSKNPIYVYFDAALSREIVKEKSVNARFVLIKDKNEIVYFVYNKDNFKKETKFDEFNKLINSQKIITEQDLIIYSGVCLCVYYSGIQSINVYPIEEHLISDSEFKII